MSGVGALVVQYQLAFNPFSVLRRVLTRVVVPLQELEQLPSKFTSSEL
jgi:hypothetical protein